MRAFVLGNGPTLPVDELHLLDGQPTIGVNRIGEVYTPTVLYWADRAERWDPEGKHTGLDCLRITSVVDDYEAGKAHRYLKFSGAERTPPEEWREDRAYIAGSSAAAMVRWAWVLGFRPVVCLGMSGEGSHFYGGEPPLSRHLRLFVLEYRRLKDQLGDDVVFADSVRGLA